MLSVSADNIAVHGSHRGISHRSTSHVFYNGVLNQSNSYNSVNQSNGYNTVFDCENKGIMKEQYSDTCGKMDRLIKHAKDMTIVDSDVPKTSVTEKRSERVSGRTERRKMHKSTHTTGGKHKDIVHDGHSFEDAKPGFYLSDNVDSDSETHKQRTNGRESPVNFDHTKTSKEKGSKRRKFRNLIPVLRRSQSCGNESQLVPDHALFLKYDIEDKDLGETSGALGNDTRRMIHKTCSADSAMMVAEGLPLDPQDVLKSKHKSSLAKNMRRKFQKLKRGNTDSLLGTAFTTIRGGLTKISQKEALQWGTSFDALLSDKNGLEMFKNFLKSEFSEENIEFWIACEEFKSVRTNKLMVEAKKIYSHYIAIKAPKQVNLDSKTRLDTVTHLDNPTRDLFKQAQKRIQFLMENDSYKRFLDSEQYRLLLRRHSGVEDNR